MTRDFKTRCEFLIESFSRDIERLKHTLTLDECDHSVTDIKDDLAYCSICHVNIKIAR